MPSARLTRFAPSPTGYLHHGHVAHMLYVWGAARAFDADVLLRIEDHDRSRCRPEFEAAILEDLDWLGLLTVNTIETPSPYRQSDFSERYQQALERLRQTAHVYRCTCTRKQLADRVAPNEDGERPYDGLCRQASHTTGGMRLQLDDGAEVFHDARLAEQRQNPSEQCGDLLLLDRAGQWTYQFAVTVDDVAHAVDFIVRGEDLLSSTGRQIRLARLLGRPEPAQFLHHPLITDDAGIKLSKKTAAAPIRDMRQTGSSPSEILSAAAHAVGLTPDDSLRERDQLLDIVAEQLLSEYANRQHQ